jgi:hypothetical protein
VANELTRLRPTEPEAQPMNDVVETAFQQAHERVARIAFGAFGFGEVRAELTLEYAVIVSYFLLLAEVDAVDRSTFRDAGACREPRLGARSRTWECRNEFP